MNIWYEDTGKEIIEVDQKIAILEIEMKRYDELLEKTTALRARLEEVEALLGKHVYWSQIFDKLEKYTIDGVYYSSMTADINGSIVLQAQGQDYESAIRQMYVFDLADDFATEVSIANIQFSASDEAGLTAPESNVNPPVTFSVDLKILPNIFYYQ